MTTNGGKIKAAPNGAAFVPCRRNYWGAGTPYAALVHWLDVELLLVDSSGGRLFNGKRLAVLRDLFGIDGDFSGAVLRSFDGVCVDSLVRNLARIASRGLVRLAIENHRMNLGARFILAVDGGAYARITVRRGQVDDHLASLLIIRRLVA